MCFFEGIQHSAPCNRTDSTCAWYAFLLVSKVKFLSIKTVFFKATKAWDALLFIPQYLHPYIQPEVAIIDQRYRNSSTKHNHHHLLSLSTVILPDTMYLVLGVLTVCSKSLQIQVHCTMILPNRQLHSSP